MDGPIAQPAKKRCCNILNFMQISLFIVRLWVGRSVDMSGSTAAGSCEGGPRSELRQHTIMSLPGLIGVGFIYRFVKRVCVRILCRPKIAGCKSFIYYVLEAEGWCESVLESRGMLVP